MSAASRGPAALGTRATPERRRPVHTEHGPVRIQTPRDRQASFEPPIVPKHERRFDGFDEKIIAMYARGLKCMLR